MRIIWAILALTLMACSLSNVPATPTSPPFPTSDPLTFTTPIPASGQSLTTITLTPTLDVTGAGMGDGSTTGGALTSSNPNCPQPVGWILYTIEAGDTLGLLSVQTDTPVADLQTANCITDVDTLYSGQVIYLPSQPVVTQ